MPKNNRKFFSEKKDWSEIKDRLLGCYLPPYFQKVLWTGRPILYVDCFAGKGKFDDGKDGSPRIALQIRDEVLGKSTARTQHIDMCLIDLNYATDLQANIADFKNQNGAISVISGKYEEQIEGLLTGKKGVNIFLYIDPYGIKALDCSLFDKFSDYGFGSIELLINMNSFGFFRDACRAMSVSYAEDEALNNLDDIIEYDPTPIDTTPRSVQALNGIAGGDYWQAIVNDYNSGKINGYAAERRFSTEYKARLREKYEYVLDMPIRLKAGQRPKYRMIHVTNHEDGCYLMAENMIKRKDELVIDIQQGGQLSLLDMNAENEFIDEKVTEDKMLDFLFRYLSANQQERLTKLIALFFVEYGIICDRQTIRSTLGNIERNGHITVIREPSVTATGKPSTFFTESSKQKVYIRSMP